MFWQADFPEFCWCLYQKLRRCLPVVRFLLGELCEDILVHLGISELGAFDNSVVQKTDVNYFVCSDRLTQTFAKSSTFAKDSNLFQNIENGLFFFPEVLKDKKWDLIAIDFKTNSLWPMKLWVMNNYPFDMLYFHLTSNNWQTSF